IGVDFAQKVLQWSPDKLVRLQLWDIAGHEKFGNMTRFYYKEAVGALIVYDVTRSYTFEGVSKWKSDLDQKVTLPEAWGGGPIPVVLLANKSDLNHEGPNTKTDAEISQYCEENGFIKWFKTSAVNNQNIEEASRSLVSEILTIDQKNDRKEKRGYLANRNDDIIKVRSEKEKPTSGDNISDGIKVSDKVLNLQKDARSLFTVTNPDAVNLGQGFPDDPPSDHIKEVVARAIAVPECNQYAHPKGRLHTRQALANAFGPLFNRTLDPETEILVTAGANEGLTDLFSAFIDHGDQAILIEPFYDQYV
ncbi:14890_t:CDS:2, partial [Cetraspora pellucida]